MAQLDPTAITVAPWADPFTLQPHISDLLETRRCTRGYIFLVENIDTIKLPEDDTLRAIRLLLGDGELCVQALLHPNLFSLVDTRRVFVGSYVRLENFVIRFEEMTGDAEAEGGDEDTMTMVYLIVNDLSEVGWNNTYVAMWRRNHQDTEMGPPPAATQDVATAARKENFKKIESRETDFTEIYAKRERPKPRLLVPRRTPRRLKGKAPVLRMDTIDEEVEDAFEAFDIQSFPTRTTPSPRPPAENSTAAATSHKPSLPVALPKDWTDHQTPLKLTTLFSIPHLPYAQNWSVNVLAIIASLSPVEPSHLPPGKQRIARITDPSTSKQVHLTVFLNPEEFEPQIGSAVLLTGVKNHGFDGGSLKKYASDAKANGNGHRWWFEDPQDMGWLDVAGIKAWWCEMQRYEASQTQQTQQTIQDQEWAEEIG